MSHKNEEMSCTIRMIAAIVVIMTLVTGTLHLTGDIRKAGVIGVIATLYAIGVLLGSCAYLHEWMVSRRKSGAREPT